MGRGCVAIHIPPSHLKLQLAPLMGKEQKRTHRVEQSNLLKGKSAHVSSGHDPPQRPPSLRAKAPSAKASVSDPRTSAAAPSPSFPYDCLAPASFRSRHAGLLAIPRAPEASASGSLHLLILQPGMFFPSHPCPKGIWHHLPRVFAQLSFY